MKKSDQNSSTVKHYSEWNGSDVYVVENGTREAEARIGYPTFIIVKDGNERVATPSETLDIKGIHPIDAKGYKGETITIDNGHESYSPNRSKCALSQHFDSVEMKCPAFPEGIPERFLSGKRVHGSIERNQVGTIIFTPSS